MMHKLVKGAVLLTHLYLLSTSIDFIPS